MKRTALKRRTPLSRSKGLDALGRPKRSPSREIQSRGGHASNRVRRARVGIPDDAPRNARGHSCIEKACVVCGGAYLAVWSQAPERKTCSRKCAAALKRKQAAGRRKGPSNPNYRHGARSGERDRTGEERWYAALGKSCQHPHCPATAKCGALALHHIVYRQHVRHAGGDQWDTRNALTLGASCHSSHHRRGRVLPLAALPTAAFEFAAELLGRGAAYNYLKRRYSGTDRRLDALIIPEFGYSFEPEHPQ